MAADDVDNHRVQKRPMLCCHHHTTTATTTPTLPTDLVLEIALRTDPATFVRCAATCKDVRRHVVVANPSVLRGGRLRHGHRFIPSLLRGHLAGRCLYHLDDDAKNLTAATRCSHRGKPISARDGLVLVLVHVIDNVEVRVPCLHGQYVLLAGDGDGDATGRPFKVVKVSSVVARHSGRGSVQEHGDPDVHAGPLRNQLQHLVGDNIIHWVCRNDATYHVLKLDVGDDVNSVPRLTSTKLPPSFHRECESPRPRLAQQILLATASPAGRLMVLVANHGRITSWMMSEHAARSRWVDRPQVVVEFEDIERQIGVQERPVKRVRLEWFAEMRGIVLVTTPLSGFFWLELRDADGTQKRKKRRPMDVMQKIAGGTDHPATQLVVGKWGKDLYVEDTASNLIPTGCLRHDKQPCIPVPVVARHGLVLPGANAAVDLRVCCPATGRVQSLPPGGPEFKGQFVLLVGDGEGNGAIGRPFKVLNVASVAAGLMHREPCHCLQLQTFSSERGTWGPRTWRWPLVAIDTTTASHHYQAGTWFSETPFGTYYVFKLDVGDDDGETGLRLTSTRLPPSFHRECEYPPPGTQQILLAATVEGIPVVLVANHGRISAWTMSEDAKRRRTDQPHVNHGRVSTLTMSEDAKRRWTDQPHVVIDYETMKRSGNVPESSDLGMVQLEWFAERSGVVQVTTKHCGFFWLHLQVSSSAAALGPPERRAPRVTIWMVEQALLPSMHA
ncbi:hypothetical protein HU200_059444 [Digitaria exilis]|uniref:DUF7595 domain-containing protein n=1 Tax=Digitaria exilis TaxID=1010633 RepID=A0A835DZR9_9POAL|nr:hypothetical protein HU200_059444 [Digitaria exilis]